MNVRDLVPWTRNVERDRNLPAAQDADSDDAATLFRDYPATLFRDDAATLGGGLVSWF
jgi:hypothetical protein